MRDLTLADQLKLLLSLPLETPVYASPSFTPWLRASLTTQWPPRLGADAGLCLVDSRDRSVRLSSLGWERIRSGVDLATLLITGTGQPGSPLRRVLRRIRRPGVKRLDERSVALRLGGRMASAQRLSFHDGLDVPTEFDLEIGPDSTGVAILMTKAEAFKGPLWSVVARQLDDPAFQIRCLQLRLRGASIIVVRSRAGERVIRAVQPGPGQEIVLKNHTRLLELRATIGNPDVRRLMPRPLFFEMHEGFALLGETYLPGVPAWQLPLEVKRQITHPQALDYLARLAADTTLSRAASRNSLQEQLQEDQDRLDRAHFAAVGVRELIRHEFQMVAELLDSQEMEAITSHGDFGYGNLLADPVTGVLQGVIDWDTARPGDFPGIDRVNLEIQIRRTDANEPLPVAAQSAWEDPAVRRALGGAGGGTRARALFGLAVARYVVRALNYPALYREEEAGFHATLQWLRTVAGEQAEALA